MELQLGHEATLTEPNQQIGAHAELGLPSCSFYLGFGTTSTEVGSPTQREPSEYTKAGKVVADNYRRVKFYQHYHACSFAAACTAVLSTPPAMLANCPPDVTLSPAQLRPFSPIGRVPMGELSWMSVGGFWELHIEVLVLGASGCRMLKHGQFYASHGDTTLYAGSRKEMAYVSHGFSALLCKALSISLYEPEGVYRFLNAVKRAYPPFFNANRNLYRRRLPRNFPVPAYYTY
jgi:hypothetical protein